MSKQLMCVLIAKMHIRLNELVENSAYNLQNCAVQHYSRRLDKVLTHYGKVTEKSKCSVYNPSSLNIAKKYLVSL